jgi:hypothetical protein
MEVHEDVEKNNQASEPNESLELLRGEAVYAPNTL